MAAGQHDVPGDIRGCFNNSRDAAMISCGALRVELVDLDAAPIVEPPVQTPVSEDEPVVVEDVEESAVVDVQKVADELTSEA
jgi:hypothetical protein